MTNKNWYFVFNTEALYITKLYCEENDGTLAFYRTNDIFGAVEIMSRSHALELLSLNNRNRKMFDEVKDGLYLEGIAEMHAAGAVELNVFAQALSKVLGPAGEFIGAFSSGGIIEKVEKYTNLSEGQEAMMVYCKEYGFDPEVDDARIFEVVDGNSTEVYSVQIEEYTSAES